MASVELVRRRHVRFERLLGQSAVQWRYSMFGKSIACNLTA
ncbi:MAG TPA: hypothetical protein VMI73_26845 [Trebonia sp.]|nr:hypothetical protein [Trebonia sp.]